MNYIFYNAKFCTTRAAYDESNEMNLEENPGHLKTDVCICIHVCLFCRDGKFFVDMLKDSWDGYHVCEY